MKNKLKRLWDKYSSLIEIFLIIMLYLAVMLILDLPCPIKHLTGISCAGCGMTRALMSAIRLDFSAAFYYHPLWILLLPFGISYIILSQRKNKLWVNILVSSAVILLVGVWLFRLIRGDGIVVFDFESSAVNMLIQKITEILN